MAKKIFSIYNIHVDDFEDISLPTSTLYEIAETVDELVEDEKEFLIDKQEYSKEEIKDKLSELELRCLNVGVTIATFAEIYSTVKKIGIEYMDASDKLNETLIKHRKDLYRLPELEKICDDKQKKINTIQLEYDRLKKDYEKMIDENHFIQKINDNNINESNDIPTQFIVKEKKKIYPDGSVLFGGHPNWQKAFSSQYGNVKIMSGTNNNFSDNVLSNETPLVILNSNHMSHSVFYKVKKLQKKYGFEIEYYQIRRV